MKATYAFSQAIVAVLTIQLAFLPVSHALKIQIKTDVKLRENTDNSMERIGMLKATTVVEIPDEYTVNVDGKPNLELTLNNWLRSGGSKRTSDGAGVYNYDGEKTETFFPVRVTKPAKGSTVRPGHQQTKHFIALKYLVRTGNAIIVSDDAEVTEADASEPVSEEASRPVSVEPSTRPDPTNHMEAQSTCVGGLCSQPSDDSAAVRGLIASAAPGLAAAAGKSGQLFQRTRNDLRHVYDNFRKSCGFDLGQFIPIIKSRAEQAGVPSELLLSLMTQESSGRCYVLNSETDSTQSVGLFQINSVHKQFPRCTSEQKNILRSLGSANRLATGPRCLENPIVNLDEAIRVLNASKSFLVSRGFDESKLSSEDLWRLTVSAYNGGPRWVLEAKKDLDLFNAKHGTSLSAHKWEDLRIFYMREWLGRDQKIKNLGRAVEGRSRANSIANLSYAENIVGRRATAASRPGLMTAWLPTVRE